MRRYELDSSSIKAASWDPDTSEAEVEFHDGKRYRYNMPKAYFEGLLTAQSKGAFLAKYVKTRGRKWRRADD